MIRAAAAVPEANQPPRGDVALAVSGGRVDERFRPSAAGSVRRLGSRLVGELDLTLEEGLGGGVRRVAQEGLERSGIRVSVGGRDLRQRSQRCWVHKPANVLNKLPSISKKSRREVYAARDLASGHSRACAAGLQSVRLDL